MINIFERYAPRYQKTVRKYARKIWLNEISDATEHEFFSQVLDFQNKYKKSLLQHYKKEGIKIYPGTITAKTDQWLLDQMVLLENINTIAREKKDDIKLSLVEKMKDLPESEHGFVQQVIDDLYLSEAQQKIQVVYKVYSFGKYLKDKADQLGEQEAFDLGADINNAVLADNSDAYDWKSQNDKRVRRTHRKLNNKTFLFSDPPTTIDEYGHIHTGNPGSDYGCRCYSVFSRKKPRLNYIVKA